MRGIGRGWVESALMTEPMAWAAVMAARRDAEAEPEKMAPAPVVVADPQRTISPVLLSRFWFGA